jgi:hypothetical protein
MFPFQLKRVAHGSRASGATVIVVQDFRKPTRQACQLQSAIHIITSYRRHLAGQINHHALMLKMGILLEEDATRGLLRHSE